MKKPIKILLIALVSLIGVIVFLIGYEVILSLSNKEDTEMMKNYETDICSIFPKEDGQRRACAVKIYSIYSSCYSPFLWGKKRTECFEQAAITINTKFRPDIATANKTPDQLIAWAHQAAKDAVDFDYKNYEEKLGHAQAYFTPAGWVSFNKALQDSNMVEATKARKLEIRLKVLGEPEIKNAFVKEGVYTWFLKFPVELDFRGENPPQPLHTILFLVVERSSSQQNPDGIGIAQWVTMNR